MAHGRLLILKLQNINIGDSVIIIESLTAKTSMCSTIILNVVHITKSSYIWAGTRENLSSGVCEQHRRRPACASAQTDLRLCYSLFGKFHM